MGTCPLCDCSKDHLGKHFALSSCGYPEISSEKLELLEGLLLGDGNISEPNSGNCVFRVSMINKEFLDWLDDRLGWLSTGVKLSKTAEQSSNNDLVEDGKTEDYSDVYRLNTVAHPKFNEYREWYDSGVKRFPKDLELTPRKMEMWYVSDGHLQNNGSVRADIRIWNERDRPEVVKNIIDSTNISGYRFDPNEGRLYFRTDSTKDLLEYIGNVTIGFEYKYKVV